MVSCVEGQGLASCLLLAPKFWLHAKGREPRSCSQLASLASRGPGVCPGALGSTHRRLFSVGEHSGIHSALIEKLQEHSKERPPT